MNVFDFALDMERDGANLYDSLADKTPITELKTIFTLLASVEREHYKKISALKNNSDYKSFESDFLVHAQNVFKSLINSGDFECAADKDNDCYATAIKCEEQSIKFYEEAASNEKDDHVKTLLMKLAQEEREHLAMVENIYDFVESPKNFLAFGEFSNIKQF